MSSGRWRGTADVANPRPREVGGACRRQVLAGARTQETVGGPNGAQRSEFRRTAPHDNKRYCVKPMFSCHVICFRGWPRLYGIDNAPEPFDVAEGCPSHGGSATPKCHRCICMTMSRIHPSEFYNHLAGTNSGRRDDATATSVTH